MNEIDPLSLRRVIKSQLATKQTDYFYGMFTKNKVIFEAGQLLVEWGNPEPYILVHTRLTCSPEKIKSFHKMVGKLISMYEEKYGVIDEST